MSCFPGANLGRARQGAADDPELSGVGFGRAVNGSRKKPRRQQVRPVYEGSDAVSRHLGWQLNVHHGVAELAGLGNVDGVVRVVAQTVWRLLVAVRAALPEGLAGRQAVQSDAEFVALGSVLRAARRAASLRQLAGAETALFH